VIYRLLVFAIFIGVGMAQGQTVFVPQIAFGNGIETEFIIINNSEDMNRVLVKAYDDSGDPVNLLLADASPFSPRTAVDQLGVEMAGKGVANMFTFSETPDQTTIGYAEIVSDFDAPFGVEVAFRTFDSTGSTLLGTTSVLPQPLTQEFSIIAYNNSFASTGFALLNPPSNSGPATVTLTLYDHFGVMVDKSEVVLEVGQKLAKFLSEEPFFPGTLAGEDDFVGSVEVSSDVPVSVTVIKLEDGSFFTTQTVQPSR
jgi:hypothetical protein